MKTAFVFLIGFSVVFSGLAEGAQRGVKSCVNCSSGPHIPGAARTTRPVASTSSVDGDCGDGTFKVNYQVVVPGRMRRFCSWIGWFGACRRPFFQAEPPREETRFTCVSTPTPDPKFEEEMRALRERIKELEEQMARLREGKPPEGPEREPVDGPVPEEQTDFCWEQVKTEAEADKGNGDPDIKAAAADFLEFIKNRTDQIKSATTADEKLVKVLEAAKDQIQIDPDLNAEFTNLSAALEKFKKNDPNRPSASTSRSQARQNRLDGLKGATDALRDVFDKKSGNPQYQGLFNFSNAWRVCLAKKECLETEKDKAKEVADSSDGAEKEKAEKFANLLEKLEKEASFTKDSPEKNLFTAIGELKTENSWWGGKLPENINSSVNPTVLQLQSAHSGAERELEASKNPVLSASDIRGHFREAASKLKEASDHLKSIATDPEVEATAGNRKLTEHVESWAACVADTDPVAGYPLDLATRTPPGTGSKGKKSPVSDKPSFDSNDPDVVAAIRGIAAGLSSPFGGFTASAKAALANELVRHYGIDFTDAFKIADQYAAERELLPRPETIRQGLGVAYDAATLYSHYLSQNYLGQSISGLWNWFSGN